MRGLIIKQRLMQMCLHQKQSEDIHSVEKKEWLHLIEKHSVEPFIDHQHIKNNAVSEYDFMFESLLHLRFYCWGALENVYTVAWIFNESIFLLSIDSRYI